MKSMKKFTVIFIVAACMAALCACSLWLSAQGLVVSHDTITSTKITSSFRVVQLSDLHDSEFGRNNERLVRKVRDQSPDLILVTGDLVNSYEEDTGTAEVLLRELTGVAPVYVSMGNHEHEYAEQFGRDLTQRYQDAGAVVLEKEYVDLTIPEDSSSGALVRLGGISGYCLPEQFLATGEAAAEEVAFLKEFQDTDRFTILMCHMPAAWLVSSGLDSWKIDCVFSGHAHGGQIRFPLIGGLYAPDQGWFPGRECGIYHSEESGSTMILSRGLGSSREMLPRFNNIPEIVVADFCLL